MEEIKRMVCCFVGAYGVGKSSIAKSFGEGNNVLVQDPTLSERYLRTFYIDQNMIYIDVIDSLTVGGITWIAEELRVDVIICVFSLGNKESFSTMKKLQKEVEGYLKNKVIWIVCGTMADLPKRIDQNEIYKYVRELNSKYYEISLLHQNINIVSIFIQAAYDWILQGDKETDSGCIEKDHCTYL
ncbi:GTP-binding protein Rhes precursor, putative [Entamoeba dispar SAW760]|uniref:GTP-binding protein Rhes, putative n=1 Tax=Entamoeba dispar (strain ATCC PRA-260 / SAW760) TaxID=370354 RepID=B0EE70_ENTDS|nr:GTP-binding protein Rhes precursor, putative [Entamoeba dispar SAW760]EDR27194.1 GTP-binding protein Rhes precursor, putative [Entamoeba dispar SAW760]|eukprot:EDR27194.1 GTP-binding protein Rhes precursor, putative [Entamoeba dispar SAW760]